MNSDEQKKNDAIASLVISESLGKFITRLEELRDNSNSPENIESKGRENATEALMALGDFIIDVTWAVGEVRVDDCFKSFLPLVKALADYKNTGVTPEMFKSQAKVHNHPGPKIRDQEKRIIAANCVYILKESGMAVGKAQEETARIMNSLLPENISVPSVVNWWSQCTKNSDNEEARERHMVFRNTFDAMHPEGFPIEKAKIIVREQILLFVSPF